MPGEESASKKKRNTSEGREREAAKGEQMKIDEERRRVVQRNRGEEGDSVGQPRGMRQRGGEAGEARGQRKT